MVENGGMKDEVLIAPQCEERRFVGYAFEKASNNSRTRSTGEIEIDLNLARAAMDQGSLRAYLGLLYLKALDLEQKGWQWEAEARQHLARGFSSTHRNPEKAAKNLLKSIVGNGYAVKEFVPLAGVRRLNLLGPARIARVLGTELGETSSIPLADCLSRKPRVEEFLKSIRDRDSNPESPRSSSLAAG